MKIKVKNIVFNPYRDLEDFPLVEPKVGCLMDSISDTCFWDNVVVRPHPDKEGVFQLAYGHHRLEAVKRQLGEDYEVDIPVKDLNDDDMLRIMAEENNAVYIEGGKANIAGIDATMLQVWEHLKITHPLQRVRSKGKTGATDILLFKGLLAPPSNGEDRYHQSKIAKQIQNWLGSNWSEQNIAESLKRLRLARRIEWLDKGVLKKGEEVLDQEAVEGFSSQTSANLFATIVEERHEENGAVISKEKQKRIAQNILKVAVSSIGKKAFQKSYQQIEFTRVIDGEKNAEEMVKAEFNKGIENLFKLTKSLGYKFKAFNLEAGGKQKSLPMGFFKSAFAKFKFTFAVVKLANEINKFGRLVGKSNMIIGENEGTNKKLED